MADKVQRPRPQGGDYRPHYRKREADAYMDQIEADYMTMVNVYVRSEIRRQDLHASIIDQGRKVLNATSDKGMSHAEYIEWAIGLLEER